ncbi:MAG: helix-turn-helix domain-containing protein [Candidatus Omnitrophica bacterium]|nr:helix-turn-helix domain-containing protein [Candidatus Omnitrophota bacterium]
MKFGKLLKQLRTKKGVSIKKLAVHLGVDYTYISKLENAKVNPSPEVVERFSEYFNYSSDELMVAAGKIPKDIEEILKNNPKKAIDFLRRKFTSDKSK